MKRKIKMGMVGGGYGAFIGEVHRKAAVMDGKIELVCGVFNSDPDKSKKFGKELLLADERVFATYSDMLSREKELPENERMDFVSIVTPNHVHFPVAKAALEHGFYVVCDKPVTVTHKEAEDLSSLVDKTGLQFAVTYTYTGYPMVKQARNMVQSGKLGKIRKIVVEYPQGWLSTRLELENQQASWRTDPKKAGPAGALGDIGSHAQNLAEYITGLRITEVCAELSSMVDGRLLDDDTNVLLRFDNDAKGILYSSQVSAGEENALRIFIYGEKGGLEWHQQDPNTLLIKYLDRPTEIYRTGVDHGYLSDAAMHNTRVPSGHPEGYIEAFANIYRNFAMTLDSQFQGTDPGVHNLDFPTIQDGLKSMAFIEAVIASSKTDEKWTKIG